MKYSEKEINAYNLALEIIKLEGKLPIIEEVIKTIEIILGYTPDRPYTFVFTMMRLNRCK